MKSFLIELCIFTIMDIQELSSDSLESVSQIFIGGIEARAKESILFIQNEYDRKELLYKAMEFMQRDFCDMMNADLNHSLKIDNFPIGEAFYELLHAINHALIGSYKASFSDLRRSLEMSLAIPYFTKENMDKYKSDDSIPFEEQYFHFESIDNEEVKKANDWLRGKSDTPFFGRDMLKELIKSGRFKEINDECQWKEKLTNLYYKITDYGHNKGYPKSYDMLNNHSHFISSIPVPKIKKETLKIFCDLYIETVQQNLVILSLYNPLVLEGLPLEQKLKEG